MMEFTARIEEAEDGWYVGQIEEVPSAIAQGRTLEELRANLADALRLIFEVNREELRADTSGKEVITERLVLTP